jgi:hypothetical protein
MKTRIWSTLMKKRKSTPKINLSGPYILILLLITLLSACGGQDARNDPDYFIPPTLAAKPATATPPPTATPEPEAANAALCTNDLRFVSDITYPDDTVVAPGQEIEKVWLVQNNGTCNWEADYTLRNVGGSPMGSSTIVALYPVRSGGEYEISITFYAPTDAGTHNSSWQAHGPEGEPFGQAFYIQIYVDPDLVQEGD